MDFGHFDQNYDFVVTEPRTPRPWYNYLFNDRYVACVSQIGTGEGFVQDDMGRRVGLVTDRRVFLVDAKATGDSPAAVWWSAGGPQPNDTRASGFACRHRPGSTSIAQEANGIASEWTLVVPRAFDGECWQLALRNKSRKPRTLRVLAFCATNLDGPYGVQGYNTSSADFSRAANGVLIRAAAMLDSPDLLEAWGCFASDAPADGFDARVNAFRGVYDSNQIPAAVLSANGRCQNTECLGEKCCFALQHTVALAPGESAVVRYAVALRMKGTKTATVAKAFKSAVARHIGDDNSWNRTLGEAEGALAAVSANIDFRTPNKAFNALASHWLPAEAALGGRWARVRHNGYRDLVSDANCLSCVDPELAWKDLRRTFSYQYSNGYAPRTFIDGKVQDRGFADCCSGIAPALLDAFNEIGDPAMLDAAIPFNDGSVASAFEHARRAADWLWSARGGNGLVKIMCGDWNDCMDRVGANGKGTSVWLSLAAVRALRAVEELARVRGDKAVARSAAQRAARLAKTINDVAWDGRWYVYAFKDSGDPVGSHVNKEGAFHLIPQLWSVFAGVVTPERLPVMLKAIDTKLADKWGTLIMDRGYSTLDPTLGYIGAKAPGIHENGGVYLHTMCWKILFEAMLGRKDALWQTLQCTLPVADGGQRRPCEPYVMQNAIFGPKTGYREGTPGQSWRCAGNGWLLRAVVTGVFGFQPDAEGLHIRPCVPDKWLGSVVTKTFRGATYTVAYRSADTSKLTVDGRALPAFSTLPCTAGATYDVVIG